MHCAQAFEKARALAISQADDEKLRHDFQKRLEKLEAGQIISAEIRRSVLGEIAGTEPGRWVQPACARLLAPTDRAIKELIEREARIVGVSTALSPSGPVDTSIVLWRNVRLIFQIAQLYGVRPDGLARYRLLRHVVQNMVVAGLSQEAMQMLYAAYGPAAVEAASRGFRSVFDLLCKGGMMLATVAPLTGGVLAAGGAAGKGVSEMAGAAAAQITGPLLQGVLNATLTIRIGLAAQQECRLISLNAEERRAQCAGIVSAILGFFLSVRRMPAQAESAAPPV